VPLPEIKPYEAYTYRASKEGKKGPFIPFYRERREEVAEVGQNSGLTKEMEREIKNRNRGQLESFELDSLWMIWILQNDGNTWAIIRDPDNNVNKVKAGNYLGRNIGKIVNIFEDRVEL